MGSSRGNAAGKQLIVINIMFNDSEQYQAGFNSFKYVLSANSCYE